MKITVVTPAYNDEKTLAQSLSAVHAMKVPGEMEHIVVDDGSDDATGKIAEEFASSRPSVICIRKQNGGEASALNQGIRRASGDLVAIIESDVEPDSDWLIRAIEEIDGEDVAGVGGKLTVPGDSSWIARIAGYEVESKFPRAKSEVFHITSANALYHRSVFDDAGFFDENLVNSCLDVDLNLRIVSKGKKLIYTPRARAIHHYKPGLWSYLKRQYAYARYRPFLGRLVLYKRDWNISAQIALTGTLVLSLFLTPAFPYLPGVLLLALLVVQIPLVVRLYRDKKDPVLFLLPLVMILRNLAGLLGLGSGLLHRLLKPGKHRA